VSFGADAANVEKARALVVRDLKAMQVKPVTDSELMRAKAEVLRGLPMERARVAGDRRAISQAGGSWLAVGLGPNRWGTIFDDFSRSDPASFRQVGTA
jgi:hypothetical protein